MSKKSKKQKGTTKREETAATKEIEDANLTSLVEEERKPDAQEIKSTQSAPEPRTITAVSAGSRLAVLAGRPSKQGVIAVFGRSGYALSWIARAEKLGTTPEELCERFKADAEGVKVAWTALTETPKEKNEQE